MDIKNLKGEVIYSSDKTTLKEVLEEAVKNRANLRDADLENANLQDANLQDANLRGANLRDADLENANLRDASLRNANLLGTSLLGANLQNTDLRGANLQDADLRNANLQNANLQNTDLWDADLQDADLRNAIGLIKIIGVKPGGIYWKRFDENLNNYGYQFKVGMNTLRKGEIFADDERVTCSFPGFHFASRSWCALHHPERFLEAKIRIPEDAKINEPWATDGKASADKIEILQVFNTKTGEDVTDQYRQKED